MEKAATSYQKIIQENASLQKCVARGFFSGKCAREFRRKLEQIWMMN